MTSDIALNNKRNKARKDVMGLMCSAEDVKGIFDLFKDAPEDFAEFLTDVDFLLAEIDQKHFVGSSLALVASSNVISDQHRAALIEAIGKKYGLQRPETPSRLQHLMKPSLLTQEQKFEVIALQFLGAIPETDHANTFSQADRSAIVTHFQEHYGVEIIVSQLLNEDQSIGFVVGRTGFPRDAVETYTREKRAANGVQSLSGTDGLFDALRFARSKGWSEPARTDSFPGRLIRFGLEDW